MRLTRSFLLSEFEVGSQGGAVVVVNGRGELRFVAKPHVLLNLQALCTSVLQPTRDLLGVPIVVTSGHRPGAVGSQHRKGEAADVRPHSTDKSVWRLFATMLYQLAGRGLVDQLIVYADSRHLHVSHKRIGRNRGQVLLAFPADSNGDREYDPVSSLEDFQALYVARCS